MRKQIYLNIYSLRIWRAHNCHFRTRTTKQRTPHSRNDTPYTTKITDRRPQRLHWFQDADMSSQYLDVKVAVSDVDATVPAIDYYSVRIYLSFLSIACFFFIFTSIAALSPVDVFPSPRPSVFPVCVLWGEVSRFSTFRLIAPPYWVDPFCLSIYRVPFLYSFLLCIFVLVCLASFAFSFNFLLLLARPWDHALKAASTGPA